MQANAPQSCGTGTNPHEPNHEVGQRRYRIRRLNASSDKYGACEVCHEHVSDVHHQTEARFYRHATGILREGWTHADCNDIFGHESCLKARRRGQRLYSVIDDGVAYDVHAAPDSDTSRDAQAWAPQPARRAPVG